MTIQREYRGGPFVVQCNVCQDAEELDGDNNIDVANDARAKGYKPTLDDDGEWQHTCTACQ